MAAPPSMRQQQRLQTIALNRALSQRQLAFRTGGRLVRQQMRRPIQHYPRNIHLMGKPKTAPQAKLFAPNPFQAFPRQPFTPFQFTPFTFTPFQFTPFQFTPFTFQPFQFQQFPQQQKQPKPPKIIGQIGKMLVRLPLKALKLAKLFKPKLKGGGGRGISPIRMFRNRRGAGPFRGRGLFGIRALSLPRRQRGIRVPTTGFRVRGPNLRKHGRPKGRRDKVKRIVRRRPATARQRLERRRWGKAGERARQRHARAARRRRRI